MFEFRLRLLVGPQQLAAWSVSGGFERVLEFGCGRVGVGVGFAGCAGLMG